MKFKSVFVALGVIATLASTNGMAVNAKSNQTDKTTEVETQKVVIVQSGDTLESIANKHETTYVHLFNANESIVHPDTINVDDKITIPAEGEEFPDRFSQLTPIAAPVATTTPVATTATAATLSQKWAGITNLVITTSEPYSQAALVDSSTNHALDVLIAHPYTG